jgi:hypothetical protein
MITNNQYEVGVNGFSSGEITKLTNNIMSKLPPKEAGFNNIDIWVRYFLFKHYPYTLVPRDISYIFSQIIPGEHPGEIEKVLSTLYSTRGAKIPTNKVEPYLTQYISDNTSDKFSDEDLETIVYYLPVDTLVAILKDIKNPRTVSIIQKFISKKTTGNSEDVPF